MKPLTCPLCLYMLSVSGNPKCNQLIMQYYLGSGLFQVYHQWFMQSNKFIFQAGGQVKKKKREKKENENNNNKKLAFESRRDHLFNFHKIQFLFLVFFFPDICHFIVSPPFVRILTFALRWYQKASNNIRIFLCWAIVYYLHRQDE